MGIFKQRAKFRLMVKKIRAKFKQIQVTQENSKKNMTSGEVDFSTWAGQSEWIFFRLPEPVSDQNTRTGDE